MWFHWREQALTGNSLALINYAKWFEESFDPRLKTVYASGFVVSSIVYV